MSQEDDNERPVSQDANNEDEKEQHRNKVRFRSVSVRNVRRVALRGVGEIVELLLVHLGPNVAVIRLLAGKNRS